MSEALTLDHPPPARLDRADTGQFPARNERPRGSYWAVVQTHPQAERWAETNLRRQGYPTLLPLMRVRRRDRVLRSLSHTVEVPLFPGYCFVTVSSHWTPIKSTLGVRRLLLDGDGKPGIVARAVISALETVQDFSAPEDHWSVGQPCSLATGSLRGCDAVVTEVHGEHATISLIMLGHMRQVSVPVACLVARDG